MKVVSTAADGLRLAVDDQGRSFYVNAAGTPIYYFDAQAADHVCWWFERYLRHTLSEWRGQPFKPASWQRTILRNLFGWKCVVDGTRRYNTLWLEVARKAGKSAFASALCLYLMCACGEQAARVIVAAASREQAAYVFGEAKQMCLLSPELSKRVLVQRNAIAGVDPGTGTLNGSNMIAVSKQGKTKHGANPSALVIDEVHAIQDQEYLDALTTGGGARRNAMTVYITTAGFDRESPAWRLHDYACKVRDGVLADEAAQRWYVAIFAADEKDDPSVPATWQKANPNYPTTPTHQYLQQKYQEFAASPIGLNTFLQLHLNVWTQQAVRAIPHQLWDSCIGSVDAAALKGRECFAAMDIGDNQDLTAVVLVFLVGGIFKLLPFFFIPKDLAEIKQRIDRVPYLTWAADGQVEMTEGDHTDQEYILRRWIELRAQYQIKEIVYDGWNTAWIGPRLKAEGFNAAQMSQKMYAMGPASKEFQRLLLSGKIHHGNHPILRWNAANLMWQKDSEGNFKPSKVNMKSTLRIDGIVASIMAVYRASLHSGQSQANTTAASVKAIFGGMSI